MRTSPRLVMTSFVAAALATLAVPGGAAYLPAGGGAWTPSLNVGGSPGCVDPAAGPCTLVADSRDPNGVESCHGTTAALDGSTVAVGFSCNATFTALVTLTGTSADVLLDPVEIETGPCAGLTLSGAELRIADGTMGDVALHPRVVVTPAGWTVEGTLVAFNAESLTAYAIDVAALVAPSCTRLDAQGPAVAPLHVTGTFEGSYQTA